MSDRTNEVNPTFLDYMQNSTIVNASGDVQLTLANGNVLSVRQEDWVDFSDLIARVTRQLVGRGFVFEKVAHFIENNRCGYFRIIADAGLGNNCYCRRINQALSSPSLLHSLELGSLSRLLHQTPLAPACGRTLPLHPQAFARAFCCNALGKIGFFLQKAGKFQKNLSILKTLSFTIKLKNDK